MAEDKQLLMQLLNMFAQQMGNIGQQRQQGSQFKAGMAQRQQGLQMQQQQIAEGNRRWQAGEPARKAQVDAANLQIKALKHEASLTKQKEQIGSLVSEYMSQEGISNFTNAEQAFEKIPGLKEHGGQIGYIGEVLQPYMAEPIGPVELLQWGAPYESFIKANPQYKDIVTPEAWGQQSSNMARIKELELENPELANELKRIQLDTAKKDFENYDKILAAKIRPPSYGSGSSKAQATGIIGEIQQFLGGKVTPNQSMALLWKTKSGESALKYFPIYDENGKPVVDVYTQEPQYRTSIEKPKGGYQMEGPQWDEWRQRAMGTMGVTEGQGAGGGQAATAEEGLPAWDTLGTMETAGGEIPAWVPAEEVETYKALRAEGLTDAQIREKYGV